MEEASQSQQYMALDEQIGHLPRQMQGGRTVQNRARQSVTEYASLYSSPRCWEIPTELVPRQQS